jgi:hypothetical protein
MLTILARKCRSVARRIQRKLWPPIDVYATHIPVLIAMPRLRAIQRVVEFGCGPFSTLAFLNRRVYPQLVELISFETDRLWADRIRARVNDPRLQMHVVDRPMSETARGVNLDSSDLVFVDDSTSVEDRAATIRAVLDRPLTQPWVVLHDMENAAYRAAVPDHLNRAAFEAYTPHTWVVWQDANAGADGLPVVAQLIARYASRRRPDQIESWLALVGSPDISQCKA